MSNNTFYSPNDYRRYLEHFGVKGMKWGAGWAQKNAKYIKQYGGNG